jgi:hypothetical protein
MSALEIAIQHYNVAHEAERDFRWMAYRSDLQASRTYLAVKEAKRLAGAAVEALKKLGHYAS